AVMDSSPEDIPRYQRVFGRPPLDPDFSRLNALAYERGGELEEAHKYWEKYEQEIAANSSHWPEGQAQRARSLIWLHMGQNAAKIPGGAKLARLPAFLRNDPDRPRPLKPSADQCFRRSLELAPDQIEPHEALFQYHLEAEHAAKADRVGRQL